MPSATKTAISSAPSQFGPAANEQPQDACERCGKPEALKFGNEFICDNCYVACGSCCAGEEESTQEL